jgi:dethiobiotin synthetase
MTTSNKSPNPPFDFNVSRWPSLPRLSGVFVTGTDTEVGKTLIAGAIARTLSKQGMKVEVFKPAATGCPRQREQLVSADADFLAACSDSRRTLSEITPVRYAAAVSPNVAAQRERRPVDLDAIFRSYASLAGQCDAVVVEGVGGLLCPISDDFWVIHLALMTRLPVLIVARPGLGTINHTLLTLHAARSAGLSVAGVIINRYQVDPAAQRQLESKAEPYTHGDAELATWTNPEQIARRGNVEVLAIVPDDPESSVEKAVLGNDVLFAIGQVNWKKMLGTMCRNGE